MKLINQIMRGKLLFCLVAITIAVLMVYPAIAQTLNPTIENSFQRDEPQQYRIAQAQGQDCLKESWFANNEISLPEGYLIIDRYVVDEEGRFLIEDQETNEIRPRRRDILNVNEWECYPEIKPSILEQLRNLLISLME